MSYPWAIWDIQDGGWRPYWNITHAIHSEVYAVKSSAIHLNQLILTQGIHFWCYFYILKCLTYQKNGLASLNIKKVMTDQSCGTRYSQAVTHPITNRTRRCLTFNDTARTLPAWPAWLVVSIVIILGDVDRQIWVRIPLHALVIGLFM